MNLEEMRMPSAALRIAHDTGGNLAETLEALAQTTRRKLALENKIRALTSQGRLQGWIMGLLPLVLAFVLFQIDPQSMSGLFTTMPGLAVCIVVTVLQGLGFSLSVASSAWTYEPRTVPGIGAGRRGHAAAALVGSQRHRRGAAGRSLRQGQAADVVACDLAAGPLPGALARHSAGAAAACALCRAALACRTGPRADTRTVRGRAGDLRFGLDGPARRDDSPPRHPADRPSARSCSVGLPVAGVVAVRPDHRQEPPCAARTAVFGLC